MEKGLLGKEKPDMFTGRVNVTYEEEKVKDTKGVHN